MTYRQIAAFSALTALFGIILWAGVQSIAPYITETGRVLESVPYLIPIIAGLAAVHYLLDRFFGTGL